MTKELKRPLSLILSIIMVVSLFAIMPITASAVENSETLDLTQHFNENHYSESFSSDHFSVEFHDENFIFANEQGWNFDGDCPEAYASLSASNDETITKIVVHRSSSGNTLIVAAGENTINYFQNGDDFTYDNINASSVRLYADPIYDDDRYCKVSSIDVYYTTDTYYVKVTSEPTDWVTTLSFMRTRRMEIKLLTAAPST